MKKTIPAIVILLFTIFVLFSCTQPVQNRIEVKTSSKNFSKINLEVENFGSITTFSDESFLIVNRVGNIKYIDKSGNIIWERGTHGDRYRLIDVDIDNKAVFLCEDDSLGCSFTKIDSRGNEIFRKEKAEFEIHNHIFVFSLENEIFGFDKNGVELFRINLVDSAFKILKVTSDSIIIKDFDADSFYIMSYNFSGVLNWQKSFNNILEPNFLPGNSTTNYDFINFFTTNNGNGLLYLNKITFDGTVTTSTIGFESINPILHITSNGEYYFTNQNGDYQYIVKLDQDLQLIWQSDEYRQLYDYYNFEVYKDELYYLEKKPDKTYLLKVDNYEKISFRKTTALISSFDVNENGIILIENNLYNNFTIRKLDHSGNEIGNIECTQPLEYINNAKNELVLSVHTSKGYMIRYFDSNDSLLLEKGPYQNSVHLIGMDDDGNVVYTYVVPGATKVVVVNKKGEMLLDASYFTYELREDYTILYTITSENKIKEVKIYDNYKEVKIYDYRYSSR